MLDKCGTENEAPVTGGIPGRQGSGSVLVHDPAICPEGHSVRSLAPAGLQTRECQGWHLWAHFKATGCWAGSLVAVSLSNRCEMVLEELVGGRD